MITHTTQTKTTSNPMEAKTIKMATAKAKNRKELAAEYGVSVDTFAKWLNKYPDLNLKPYAKLLTPLEVASIYKVLGKPQNGLY